jgi:hypothetical protein
MPVRSIVGATLFVVAALCSMPSHALIVEGGFAGTIFSGFDLGGGPGGFFGAGTDLEDLPITGTFRYDTANVPPGTPSAPNSVLYSDPSFSTDFLALSVTINGRTYSFGALAAPPGIQSIEVTDDTDQLQFDYQRFGLGESEAITLRFISDIDFLTGTGVPTAFDFVASGIGLTPGGTFSFDLANGDSAFASFTLDTGFARALVAEPPASTLAALGLLAIFALLRRRQRVAAARDRRA